MSHHIQGVKINRILLQPELPLAIEITGFLIQISGKQNLPLWKYRKKNYSLILYDIKLRDNEVARLDTRTRNSCSETQSFKSFQLLKLFHTQTF